jgi:O-antigen/teichoic acid export membrane protein
VSGLSARFERLLVGLGFIGESRGFAAGAFGGLVVVATGMIVSLLNTILLSRTLGPQGYGAYSLALSIVTTAFMVLFAGLGTLLVRDVAIAVAAGRTAQASAILRAALLACVAISLAGCGLLLVAVRLFSSSDLQMGVTLMAAAMLPLLSVTFIQSSVLRGLGHVTAGLLPDLVVRPSLFLVLLWGGLVLAGAALTPAAAMTLHAAAAAATLVVASTLQYRFWPAGSGELPKASATDTAPAFAGIMPLTLVAAFQTLNANVDVLSLGALTDQTHVGIYRVAWQPAFILATAVAAMQVALQPRIARLHAEGRMAELQHMLILGSRGMLAAVTLPALVLIFAGEPILVWAFGPAYGSGAAALAILACGQLAAVAAGANLHVLNMTPHARDSAVGLVGGFVLNFLLCVALIPRLDATGAALASTISLIVLQVFLAWRVRRRTGLASTALGV